MNRPVFLLAVVTGIGITTLTGNPAAAQGLLERLGERLRAQAAQPNPAAAAPASAYIGLVGDDRGEAGRGVRVLTVRPDSPAEQAGIRPRDLITGIGSRTVRSIDDMVAAVTASRPGEPLKFSIERSGSRMLINVVPTLRPPPDSDSPPAPRSETLPPPRPDSAWPPAGPASVSPVTLGIRVVPLDERTRSELRLTVRQGVVIQSVDFGSPAEAAGLPVGGVIVAVDARPVESPEDLAAVIQAARPGQKIEITYYHDRIAHRKSVTLAAAPAGATSRPGEREPDLPLLVPPRADPGSRDADPGPDEPRGGLRILPGGDVPPAVREVERLLDRVLAPPAAAPAPVGGADPRALQAEIDRLQERVRQLESRMAELEGRLSAPHVIPADE